MNIKQENMKAKSETKYSYNPWPLGKLKKRHRRPEPKLLKGAYIGNENYPDVSKMFKL